MEVANGMELQHHHADVQEGVGAVELVGLRGMTRTNICTHDSILAHTTAYYTRLLLLLHVYTFAWEQPVNPTIA